MLSWLTTPLANAGPQSLPEPLKCSQEVSYEAHKQVGSAAAGFHWTLLSLGHLCLSTSAGHDHRTLCLLSTSTTFRHRASQSPSGNTCPSTEALVMPRTFKGLAHGSLWHSWREYLSLLCASQSSPARSSCLKKQPEVGLFHFLLRALSPQRIGMV